MKILKRNIILFFLSITFFLRVNGQINLVPNYSFENTISCPQPELVSFYSYTPPWFCPNQCTPDIFNNCSSGNIVSVPINCNGFGFQYAKTGNGYAGFARYTSSNVAEYLSVKLISPLQSGKKYCICFFVNTFNHCYYVIDAIGAYISYDSLTFNACEVAPYIPQIENPLGNIISDTVNWTEISGEYTASGGEQYITIGSFYPDSIIHYIYGDTINPPGSWPYYYLDDVYVYLCDDKVPAEAGSSQTICKGDSVQIGSTPKSEYAYHWHPAIGLNNDSIANPKAGPPITTTYYLQQTDFMGDITYDSVTINVIQDCDTTSDDIFIPNIFSPNGDLTNDVLYVRSHNIKTMDLNIYNRWGEKVFETKDINKGWDGRYNGGNCNEGVFVWYLNATLKDDKTIVKKGNITLIR
jgi:gliding motility-associated-like protein